MTHSCNVLFSSRPCDFWRWTHPGADLEEPATSRHLFCDKEHTELSNPPRYPCKHRRCELMAGSATEDHLGPESHIGYILKIINNNNNNNNDNNNNNNNNNNNDNNNNNNNNNLDTICAAVYNSFTS